MGVRKKPYVGFRFLVQITGKHVIADMGFTSVGGLKLDVNFTEYREGGDGLTHRQIAGMHKYEPIILKRGLSKDLEAVQAVVDLQNKPQEENDISVTITLMDRDGNPVKEYFVPLGWISGVETGEFDANSEDAVIETITITHEGWTVKSLV